MKTIPIALQAHYESGSTTLAMIWKITRTDGLVFGFTDHDEPIPFGGTTYRPTSAFDASAVSTRGELNVDNLEAVGLLDDDGIAAEDIDAGLWDGAAIEIRRVNWADLSMGAEIVRVGEIGQVQRKRGQYIAEMRGLMQKLQNNIGRTVAPSCDAVLGDARCGIDLAGSPGLAVAGVVTAVAGRRAFTATALAQAAAHFTAGEVHFTSGANEGIRMEVKTHSAGGVFALQLALPFDLAVSDTFTVVPGCDKTKATCIAKFNNVLNFRGFSFVPGPDRAMLFGGQ